MSDQTDLIPVQADEIRLGTLQIATPQDVIQVATEIASALAHIINDRKLYSQISGKKFVRVEGWETLGAMLGISPLERDVKRYDDGTYEAIVELIRDSDGAIVGRGSAICGVDEKRWQKADEYARRSMAITRATGKAFRIKLAWVMALAGYETTPAEEIPADIVEGKVKNAEPEVNGNEDIYQTVVDAKYFENVHNARNALRNYCATGYNTKTKAKAWSKLYRGWRDMDKTPQEAGKLANEGKEPK